MSSKSPPKAVSLGLEDTVQQEMEKTETAPQHAAIPVQRRHPLSSNRPDNNAKRCFDSTVDTTLQSQSKNRKKSRTSFGSNIRALPCFGTEQLRSLQASYSENGAAPDKHEVDRLAVQTGRSRTTIKSWFATKIDERGMTWQLRLQHSRTSQSNANSYAPEPPPSPAHNVESRYTHDELAVAHSVLELARPIQDVHAFPAPEPTSQSPHTIAGDQTTISLLGLLPTRLQPSVMQPSDPGTMLPQDQINLLDGLFRHSNWIQNSEGYSKVIKLMRHAHFRTLTQIGSGPFTRSGKLAAIVRNKFVNQYRRTRGEAISNNSNSNIHKSKNEWFKSLSSDEKDDHVHYVMRQLVGLLTVDEQRKSRSSNKKGLTMSVSSGSGIGITNIGLGTEIGTPRRNTNERVTRGMTTMATTAPCGPFLAGAAHGMSLARNPTPAAAEIASVGGSSP